MSDRFFLQKNLLDQCLEHLGAKPIPETVAREALPDELRRIAEAAATAVNTSFDDIAKVLNQSCFDRKFQVDKASGLKSALGANALAKWYAASPGEQAMTSKMQPKSFVHLCTVLIHYLRKSKDHGETFVDSFRDAIRPLHGPFANAQQFNAMFVLPSVPRAAGLLSEAADSARKSTREADRGDRSPSILTPQNGVVLRVPSTHTRREVLEFEKEFAGIYDVFRRHTSRNNKYLLKETMIIYRQEHETGEAGIPALIADYVGIEPSIGKPEKSKIELWEMSGVVTHGSVVFHMWRDTLENRFLHETLTFPRLRKATFEVATGMLTGLTDDSDWLCAVPVIVRKTSSGHSVTRDAFRSNIGGRATILSPSGALYKELKPLFYHSDGNTQSVHLGPGVLAVDQSSLRMRFVEALHRFGAQVSGPRRLDSVNPGDELV